MVLKKAQHSWNTKKSNGRRVFGCMTWRVTRRFHWALSLVVGSLVMVLGFKSHQLWYAICGQIHPSLHHSWQIFIYTHSIDQRQIIEFNYNRTSGYFPSRHSKYKIVILLASMLFGSDINILRMENKNNNWGTDVMDGKA